MFIPFLLYFIALISIGIYFYKRNQTASQFMLGNRTVNYWVTAIATQASDMGSWLFLGFPAMVFSYGMFQCWTAVGLLVGMFCAWTFIAPRLREKTAQLNALTLSSYFADRFNDRSGMIQLISSCFAMLFFTFYIASGLVGLTVVFSSAFGISYHVGILISVATAGAYTLIGGFVAVAWCDFFQGIFLLVMIILVPLAGLLKLGGIAAIISAAHLNGISLSLIASPMETLSALFLAASWGLGYAGQPHILVNFMGIDDPKNIAAARRVGIIWQALVLSAAVAIGLVGIGMFPEGLSHPQQLFIGMTTMLFNPFMAGLILCAIFAATLSTMDSLILVAGSSLAEDIYKQFFNKQSSAEQLLRVSRMGSVAISLLALALAWNSSATIYGLVNYAWSGLGSTFGPLVIVSLTDKKISADAAIIGLIFGGLTSALWPFIFGGFPLVPGFIAGLCGIGLGSLFFKN